MTLRPPSPTTAWKQFWFAPLDPLPVAITRVGSGLLAFVILGCLRPNWERFYATDGILSWCEPSARTLIDGGWSLITMSSPWLPLETWWWIGMAASLGVALGWHTRLATVTLYLVVMSLVHRNPIVVNGEDLMLRMLLFCGCFSAWGTVFSLDALRSSSPPPAHASAWPIRLMQLNVLLVYVISVPYKLAQDPDWITGDALHWTIASDTWWIRGFLPELTLVADGLLRRAMTWGTLAVEGLFPLLVCFRATRLPAVAAIAGLHLGIAMLIPNVTFFTLMMVASFGCFLPPDWLRRHLASADRGTRRWLSSSFALFDRTLPSRNRGVSPRIREGDLRRNAKFGEGCFPAHSPEIRRLLRHRMLPDGPVSAQAVQRDGIHDPKTS